MKKEKYVPVHSSGEIMGKEITLNEIRKLYRLPIKLVENIISLVGGLVVWGKTKNDFEQLIRVPPREELIRRIIFRLDRAIADHALRKRMHPLDDYWGPFTDALPLYDLVLMPSENAVLRMAESLLEQEVRAKSPKAAAQAKKAKRLDKITLGEFFMPLKTPLSSLIGYRIGEKYSVESMIEYLKKVAQRKKLDTEIVPSFFQKKYDGLHVLVHKLSSVRVIIFSDDGSDITERLPGIVQELKKFKPDSYILDAELEGWIKGKHVSREDVAAYIHRKDEPDDSDYLLNCFDLLWIEKEGDLHKRPQSERIKFLNALDFPQSTAEKPDLKKGCLNLAPTSYAEKITPARKALIFFSKAEGSEGAMVKYADMVYSLTGSSTSIVKLKTYAEVHGIVWRRNTTKIPTVFNYDFAIAFSPSDKVDENSIVEIKGKKYSKAGRSYDTNTRCDVGDIITIRFHTVNKYKDPETGTVSYHFYEPIFYEKREKEEEPDSFTAIERIGKESGLMREKDARQKFSLEEVIGQAIGEASMCWSKIPTGIFDSNNANKIITQTIQEIKEILNEGIKPAFGSPGGKFFMAGQLVRLIPEHKTYVEAFIGGGSLFYRKKPSEKEVINDLDKDVAFCHRFMQGCDEAAMAELKKKNWKISKALFHKLKNTLHEEVSDPERFYRITMLKAYSDAGEMSSYDDRKDGHTLKIMDRVPRCKERLKGVTILNQDYREVIKKYDGQDTFFYLDPPYPKADMNWKNMPKQEEIEETIKSIKGKFLLSYEKTRGFDSFQRRTIKTRQIANPSKPQDKIEGWKKELLVANYPFKDYNQYMTEALEITDRYFEAQTDPYMHYPSEEKTYTGIWQHHYRGKSVHIDQRNEGYDDELIGWTINDGIAGAIKEPVLTVAQAKALDKKDIFKINYQTGKWKQRMKKGAVKPVNVQIVVEKKAPEPHEWIGIEGVVKPGEVGATKQYPGVFTIMIKGPVEYGSQKTWSHEYFYNMPPIDYRIVYRRLKLPFREAVLSGGFEILESVLLNNMFEDDDILEARLQEAWDNPEKIIESLDLTLSAEIVEAEKFVVLPAKEMGLGRAGIGWVAIKPVVQEPYVLSRGAEKKDWLPPAGISALPKKVREKVPEEMRYWKTKDRAKALEIRSELRKHFMEIDMFKEAQHKRDQCMDCSKPPVYEVLWAEGMAHAWFCKEHFNKWSTEHKGDIDYVKEVKDGEAAKKFQDNPNPNIIDQVSSEAALQTGDFVIQHHWAKGPMVIRYGASWEHWDLRIDTGKPELMHMVLEHNPIEVDETSFYFKPCRDKSAMMKGKKVEFLKPGTKWNPSKATPAWISIIASGKVTILEDKPMFKKFQFKNKKFRGLWIAKREAPKAEFWVFKRSELPKAK